jgi:hypothetical protein
MMPLSRIQSRRPFSSFGIDVKDEYMRRIARIGFVSIALLLFTLPAFSQGNERVVPKLILLNPYVRIVTNDILRELKAEFQKTSITQEDSVDIATRPIYDSILMSKANVDNLLNNNYLSLVPKIASTYLGVQMYDFDPMFFAFPVSDISVKSKQDLKVIANKYHVIWLINFPEMRLSTQGKNKQVEIHIQVYNSNTDSFVLEKKITSRSGKELICSEDTWGCILTNTIMSSMDEIVNALKK